METRPRYLMSLEVAGLGLASKIGTGRAVLWMWLTHYMTHWCLV